MNESDLRLHLGKQTNRKINLIDLFELEKEGEEKLKDLHQVNKNSASIVLFDTLTMDHLLSSGELIVRNKSPQTQLIIGASSAEHAICLYLHKIGKLHKPPKPESPGKRDQIIAVSGSCAPTTGKQISHAISKGFVDVRIDTVQLVDPEQSKREEDRIFQQSISALEKGQDLMIYSAIGPEDPMIEQTKKALKAHGLESDSVSQQLGKVQGDILKRLIAKHGKIRTVVCGGDTSGHVARALGIKALETLMPIAPGAPLCYAHADDQAFDGLEISLKGGQNGSVTYIESIKEGMNIHT